MTKIALQLTIFVVAALPGYIFGILYLDRIGHRRLQRIGFAAMGACFAIIAVIPGMTTTVAPFLLVYGVSYFFTQFGPNMTTFVIPSEVFPVALRATGHGISAGIGKLGAFIGVFLFPVLQTSFGLRGTLLLTAGVSVLGFTLTRVLPEPAGTSLDDISGHHAADTHSKTRRERAPATAAKRVPEPTPVPAAPATPSGAGASAGHMVRFNETTVEIGDPIVTPPAP
jgi:MFS family permease